MNSQKYDQQDSDHGTKKCSFFNKTLQEKKEMENLIKQPSAVSTPHTVVPKITRHLGINLIKEVLKTTKHC